MNHFFKLTSAAALCADGDSDSPRAQPGVHAGRRGHFGEQLCPAARCAEILRLGKAVHQDAQRKTACRTA